MSEKWVCIHGHFYQPPRENPWLEAIEPQPSAHPYRDWNERITAECYRPNAAARVIDGDGQIIQIVDNYAAHELQRRADADVVARAARARRPRARSSRPTARAASASRRPRLGDGAGLQPHDHAARVAARSARRRCGGASPTSSAGSAARPRGCGCPSARSTPPTLEALAAEGIAFTVLAPHQAQGVAAAGRRVAHDARSIRAAPTGASCRRGGDRSVLLRRRRRRRRSRSSGCSADGQHIIARHDARAAPSRATSRRCATSRPTARPTATITATATWRSRGRSRRSSRAGTARG